MSSWFSPADHASAEPAPVETAEPAVVPAAPWWSEPAEPDSGKLPTMAQLDALSAELDEIDGALASMDSRALAGGAVPGGPDRA